ncbi:MAG: LLM class F420-dependent oxidoreductase [Salinirussus sp.]
MEIGTTFPQLEIGEDPATIAEYARRIEAAGYEHTLLYDHVLGVNPDWTDWEGPYNNADTFHEPLTTLSFLAAHTDDLQFVTGILILPQRQTALVAKQTAQLDRLSEGRLRLGVGVGWNPYEYIALGEDFGERGRRIEEQLEVLDRLWTEPVVEFEGEYHDLREVGINPRPVQQPIPLWMGGRAPPVKRRIARHADGWLPRPAPGDGLEEHWTDIKEAAREIGRDPDEIGLHGRPQTVPGDLDATVDRVKAWAEAGADYVGLNTMDVGLDGPDAHIAHLEAVADALRENGLF